MTPGTTLAQTDSAASQDDDAPLVFEHNGWRETLVKLGEPHDDHAIVRGSPVASIDQAHIGFQVSSGVTSSQATFVDSQSAGGGHDQSALVFGPNGDFAVVVQATDKWHAMINRKPYDGYAPIAPPMFSPDGSRMVYLARDKQSRFVVEDTVPQGAFAQIDPGSIRFSHDSTLLAYPAWTGAHWTIVVNGRPQGVWSIIGSAPTFAKNNNRMVFTASRGGKWYIVDNGQPLGDSHPKFHGPPVLSADGALLAYWAVDHQLNWRLYLEDQTDDIHKTTAPGDIAISDDGVIVAASLKRHGAWHVLVNSLPGEAYEAIGRGSLIISPDGQGVAYGAFDGRRWFAVVDEIPGPGFEALLGGGLVFSPLVADGSLSRAVYAGRRDGVWWLMDGPQKIGPFNAIYPSTYRFAPNDGRLAFIAQSQSLSTVMVDGQPIGQHQAADWLTWSPDGSHFAYLALDHGQWRLWIDGQPTQTAFHDLPRDAKPFFVDENTIRIVGTRREPRSTFYSLTVELQAEPSPSPVFSEVLTQP